MKTNNRIVYFINAVLWVVFILCLAVISNLKTELQSFKKQTYEVQDGYLFIITNMASGNFKIRGNDIYIPFYPNETNCHIGLIHPITNRYIK